MLDVWLVEKWLQRNSELDDVGYITRHLENSQGLQQEEIHAEAVRIKDNRDQYCTYYIKKYFYYDIQTVHFPFRYV